jgi:hypothetical protein
MGNNELIKICMNDEIMEENGNINKKKSIKWERRINEDIFFKYMHREKLNNHMEDYLCVGVFIVLMII